jgi:hypothetical protein
MMAVVEINQSINQSLESRSRDKKKREREIKFQSRTMVTAVMAAVFCVCAFKKFFQEKKH